MLISLCNLIHIHITNVFIRWVELMTSFNNTDFLYQLKKCIDSINQLDGVVFSKLATLCWADGCVYTEVYYCNDKDISS